MYYYEILPRDASYHSEKFLTYHSEKEFTKNKLIFIKLRSKKVIGIVIRNTTKPKFKTNPILDELNQIPNLPDETLKLINWLHSYYPSSIGGLLNQFIPSNVLLIKQSSNAYTTTNTNFSEDTLPKLSSEQADALSKIVLPGTYILHGDTGSGKTRIYQELALRNVNQKKSVLILTPEISLTPQLAQNLKSLFHEKVIVIHSKLSQKKRAEIWLEIATGNEPKIVLGPRSALFSPFHNLGLIVIDESHESSYKQEQSPYYQTIRVAGKLAELHKAYFVIGSATPKIEDYYLAKTKNVPIIRMKGIAKTNSKFTITKKIIDIKDKSLFTKSSIISDALITEVEKSLDNHEQSLLFLNRIGTSRIIFCDSCGWQDLCPNCDVPLVYHGDEFQIRCHTCSYRTKPKTSCPKCGNQEILYKGFGTKAIVNEIEKLFPQAKIKRFDKDNKKDDSFEHNYYSVKDGDVDIIIGTQGLIKGLDLPKLSTIGVIVADSALSFPDYTATEKSYQQINQVIGRIGRGHRDGTAIIQTYNPDSNAVKDAVNLKYEDFYANEILEREKYHYPPFRQILKLTCLRATEKNAALNANKFKEIILKMNLDVELSGPAKSFRTKVDNKFQYQIIIKSKLRSELIKIIKNLPNGWNYDIDPINLL